MKNMRFRYLIMLKSNITAILQSSKIHENQSWFNDAFRLGKTLNMLNVVILIKSAFVKN